MMRVLRRAVLALMLVAALLAGAWAWGWSTRSFALEPLHGLASRIEARVLRLMGAPTQTEAKTAVLETTFLRLRGTTWPEPGRDFVPGGAMTVWGADLVVIDRLGRFHVYEEGKGLFPLSITPPENGLADYIAISKTEKYRDYVHKPDRHRFNDVTHVAVPGGLHGLALSYTYFDRARECYVSRVSWRPLAADETDPRRVTVTADQWQTLFDTYPCQPLNRSITAIEGHFAGGRMAFQPPSTLYFGSGFYGLDSIHAPDGGLQDDASAYGKVIAIDLAAGTSRIVSKGHRNLQGLALDPQGRLWVTEHGERGGDELNLIVEGGDYGFPSESLSTLYSGLPQPIPGEMGRHDRFRQPVFAWLPSAAVSSLTTIRGIDPSWDGDLLAGSLSSEDFGQSLWHIRITGERVVFVERIRLGRRIRHVQQWGERIAVWLDSNELVLFSAERRQDPLAETLAWVEASHDAAMAAQVTQALKACNECHSFEEEVQAAAPSLNGVVGRKVAATTFQGYSDAMRARDGRWDRAALTAFLSDPEGTLPGTAMPDPGLAGRPELVEALIGALERIDSGGEEDLRYD